MLHVALLTNSHECPAKQHYFKAELLLLDTLCLGQAKAQ